MIFFQNLTENFPFFSLTFSLVLISGLYQFGEIIFYNKNIRSIFLNISELKYQKILIAINFIMIILLPIVLFFQYSKEVLIFTSILIFVLGLFKIIFSFKKKINFKKKISLPKYNTDYLLFLLTILGFFLITFSPVNHADSLSYHSGGAETIFYTGKLPTGLENFEFLLIGSGEVFMSLGVLFGAEQFGNLVQFSALLSLIGVVKRFNNNNKFFFLLLILTSPVLIFLASSPKPQLFHIISNTIIFVILFINFNYFKSSKYFLSNLVIITNIFIINSINAKFSFIISATILYVILAIYSYKKNFLIQMIFINLCFLIFFYLGFVYWKYITWGGFFIDYILNPLPLHLEGMNTFYQYLIDYKRAASFMDIFIPPNMAQFTDPLGIGVLIFIYFFFQKNKLIIYFIPIFLFVIIVNYFFGQPSSRFFFEVYIWMILLLASLKNLYINNKVKFIFYFQFFLSVLAIWYGVFTLSYGFINSDLREYIMKNTANGYSLFNWSNSVLNKDDRVISMHRSVYLGKTNTTLATNFANWTRRDKDKIRPYHVKNLLVNHSGSTYLLTFGDKNNVSIFNNCIDYLYLTKKNVGSHVGRNPFNKSSPYNGYLYKLKDLKKTKCYKY
jgi:hypothetical protein